MTGPRVFLCFAGKDRPYVRRLMARLRAQPIAVWDYSHEGEEIPLGSVLVDDLRRRVDASDVFIPVVTPAALDSWLIAVEVGSALARRAVGPRPQLIPLVARGVSLGTARDPFRRLAGFLHYEIDLEAFTEETVARLCRSIGADYRPSLLGDRRLPFLPRLEREIRDRVPRDRERDNAVYTRLLLAIDRFQGAFADGDFARAAEIASYAIGICEYEFPEERFYYPYVVKAVCAMALGRHADIEDAVERLRGHASADENVPALDGYLALARGSYTEAVQRFGAAAETARRLGHDPAPARAWQIHALLRAGQSLPDGAELGELEEATTFTEVERNTLRTLAALAEATRADVAAAARLEALVEDGSATAPVLVEYARVLRDGGRAVTARNLLETHLNRFDADAEYRHALGSICFATGQLESALAHFRRLVEHCPTNRQYLADAAQVAWALGLRDEACWFAGRMLAPSMPLPASAVDFDLDGLANFILGRKERALYDRERSGAPGDYRQILDLARRAAAGAR